MQPSHCGNTRHSRALLALVSWLLLSYLRFITVWLCIIVIIFFYFSRINLCYINLILFSLKINVCIKIILIFSSIILFRTHNTGNKTAKQQDVKDNMESNDKSPNDLKSCLTVIWRNEVYVIVRSEMVSRILQFKLFAWKLCSSWWPNIRGIRCDSVERPAFSCFIVKH